jgi:hypothetical protein
MLYREEIAVCVISGSCRDGEICGRLVYCAAKSGNSVPTFRGNLSVPVSRAK